jgi:hypothetical protein
MSDRLPIYRIGLDDTTLSRHIDFAQRVLDLKDDFQLLEANGNRVLRHGQQVVEVALASGGIWAADESQLWKPSTKPSLLKADDAIAEADRFLRQRELLPGLGEPFRYGQPIVGGTWFALRQKAKRQDRRLDVQVCHPILVGEYPVVGGGGDFKITFGDQRKIIAFSGCWRPAKEAFEAKLIDRKTADEQFRAMTAGLKVESFDAYIAYYSAPAFQIQEFLYPVYVYQATAIYGDRRMPLRQIMLPATDFGPPVVMPDPQPPRKRAARPAFLGGDKNKLARRDLASRGPWRPWEAGTSWIGLSGGLAGSQANAQGFVDEWEAAGWHIDFNWGDANAWESDWRRNNDTWVDNADFVFYTGHADVNGWVLASPDDGSLDFWEVGAGPETPGDLWGQSDLEWVIIAACGPLEDDILAAGGGDVLDRWDGAFDGMHILMGYGAVTSDNTEEGRRVSQYAKDGSTLIDAWFRTACEIQDSQNGWGAPYGPTVYVGAMWVGRDGIDPFNDHAWDFGSVSADPTNPTWLAAMWTMC